MRPNNWLERLVIAHQHQHQDESVETPVASVVPDGHHQPQQQQLIEEQEQKEEESSSIERPASKCNYYYSDHLPTIDLSQLTLTLDSELIFPT